MVEYSSEPISLNKSKWDRAIQMGKTITEKCIIEEFHSRGMSFYRNIHKKSRKITVSKLAFHANTNHIFIFIEITRQVRSQ